MWSVFELPGGVASYSTVARLRRVILSRYHIKSTSLRQASIFVTRSLMSSVCLLPLSSVHPFYGWAGPVLLCPSIFTEKIAFLEVRPSSIPITWDYGELAGMELEPP